MKINQDILHYWEELVTNDDWQAFKKVYAHYYNRLFSKALYYLNNNSNYAQEWIQMSLWQGWTILDKVKKSCCLFLHCSQTCIGKGI